MEIALITFAAGDLTTDILFVKQIRDRMVYCFDIINKYPDKNTSAFQKEAEISNLFFHFTIFIFIFIPTINGMMLKIGKFRLFFLELLNLRQLCFKEFEEQFASLSLWWDSEHSSFWRASTISVMLPLHFVYIIVTCTLSTILNIILPMCAFVVLNITMLCLALCSSELNYHFYGPDAPEYEHYFKMTTAGIMVEDFPQLLMQIGYAVLMSQRFHMSLLILQWFSFAFTLWRIQFSLLQRMYDYRKGTVPAPVPFHPGEGAAADGFDFKGIEFIVVNGAEFADTAS